MTRKPMTKKAMIRMINRHLLALCATPAFVFAGQWEVGALGGFGYAPKLTARAPAGSANAGFENGVVVGAFGGNDTYRYWSGEARYLYRFSDLELQSGGARARLGAHTHILHADFLGHFRPVESRVRPFVAFGGGAKILQGTGVESASQPLGRVAALTATQELLPVADVGVGVKIDLNRQLRLRFEVRDYLSPAPSRVFTPAPGGSIGAVQNDVIGLVGVSFTFF